MPCFNVYFDDPQENANCSSMNLGFMLASILQLSTSGCKSECANGVRHSTVQNPIPGFVSLRQPLFFPFKLSVHYYIL